MKPFPPTLASNERLRAAEHRADPHGDFTTFEHVKRVGQHLLLDDVQFGTIDGPTLVTPFGVGVMHPGMPLAENLVRIKQAAYDADELFIKRTALFGLFAYMKRVYYRDMILANGDTHIPERVIRMTDDLRHVTDVLFVARPGHMLTMHGVPIGCTPHGSLLTPFGRVPSSPRKEHLYTTWCKQLEQMATRARAWIDTHDLRNIDANGMREYVTLLTWSKELDDFMYRFATRDRYPLDADLPYKAYRDMLHIADARHAERLCELVDTIHGIDRKHPLGLSVDERSRIDDLRALLARPLTFDSLRIQPGGELKLTRDGRQVAYAQLHRGRNRTHIVFAYEREQLVIPDALVVNSGEYVAYLQSKLAAQHAAWCERIRYDLSLYDVDPYDPVTATAIFRALETSAGWVD